MAIRLRKIGERWIALCAARSKAKEGDVYLDDGQHDAIWYLCKEKIDDLDSDEETDVLIYQEEDPELVNWWESVYNIGEIDCIH